MLSSQIQIHQVIDPFHTLMVPCMALIAQAIEVIREASGWFKFGQVAQCVNDSTVVLLGTVVID